jgi:hypothetical protein
MMPMSEDGFDPFNTPWVPRFTSGKTFPESPVSSSLWPATFIRSHFPVAAHPFNSSCNFLFLNFRKRCILQSEISDGQHA